MVQTEVATISSVWHSANRDPDMQIIAEVLGDGAMKIDEFDRTQLASVIRACRQSANLSAAGRRLFAVSRMAKTSKNDADRLRKYLEKFGLDWLSCQG